MIKKQRRNALVNIWNIWGLLGKDGKEIPFKTSMDLENETAKRIRKIELDTTNLHIRIRNEVRDREDEMTQKALELFKKPHFINYVIQDLCGMIKEGTQYDELPYFIEKNIIDPLEENGKIKFIYYCQTLSSWSVAVFQNTEFIDPQKKYPAIKIQKFKPE
jgi:hypothetical protein